MNSSDEPTRSVLVPNAKESNEGTITATIPSEERYKLGTEIDRGGMGIVYRATDRILGRDVAVKVLHDKYREGSAGAARFAVEAQITGQLQHPSIPPVHDVGTLSDGRPFLAMKLIKGRTFADLLRERADPTQERGRFLAIFEQICHAVGYAHSHNVIHRDLKPGNVMVGAFGEVQVMDWGLAKVLGLDSKKDRMMAADEATQAWTQISPAPELGSQTIVGSTIGTPAFAPPEQVAGELSKVDTRSDVFGLGSILSVILTGKPPYVGESLESVRVLALRGRLDECFQRLDACCAEQELVSLCKQCLAFEPDDRPPHGGDVAKRVAEFRTAAEERALKAEIAKVRVETERTSLELRAVERRKRQRLWFGAVSLLAISMVGGLSAVIAVQRRANALLTAEKTKVQSRFDTAVKAIETYHTGVSQDTLLKNPQFSELRTKLLQGATRFYGDLETLLLGQTDAHSRRTLAKGYEQLANLTSEIGSKHEALKIYRKALTIWRELTSAHPSDMKVRLDLARSLGTVGILLETTGDPEAAMSHYLERRDLCLLIDAAGPIREAKMELATAYNDIGIQLMTQEKWAEAKDAFLKRLSIIEEMSESWSDKESHRTSLAMANSNMGILQSRSGNHSEAIEWFQKALVIQQAQADANPAHRSFARELANTHNSIGAAFFRSEKYTEALKSYQSALQVQENLTADYPAVTEYQVQIAYMHFNIGEAMAQLGTYEEALDSVRKAERKLKSLVDLHPGVIEFEDNLAKLQKSLTKLEAFIDNLGK